MPCTGDCNQGRECTCAPREPMTPRDRFWLWVMVWGNVAAWAAAIALVVMA